MLKYIYLLLVGGLLTVLFPVRGFAQSRLDSLQHLKEVVVTAQKHREVIPVQSLSGMELKKLSAHSVGDAIRYFSGLQVKDYGGVGGLKTANIRSLGTNHVGVFYDGIELGNAQNGIVDLGRFSLDNMEMVSVYNGQKSDIFQSAKDFGSAGTIYLQSRTPLFTGQKRYNLKATLRVGSFDVINPSFLFEKKLSSRVSASCSAELLSTSGKYKFKYKVRDAYDTTAVRHNGDVLALRAETGVYGKMDDGYWRAKVYFYQSKRGYPGCMVKNKFTHEDRQWDTSLFGQAAFKKDVTTRYSLLISGKMAYDYLRYLADPHKDESLMYVDNSYYQTEAYLSVVNRYKLTKFWEVNLSADYQRNSLDANLMGFPYPRRHTLLAAAATSLHVDRFKLQASVLGTFVHETVKADTLSAKDNKQLTPALIASWQPFKNPACHLRAFYKRIFRMPTLNDLYYTFVGNITLKPEYTNQYNLGGTYDKEWRHAWLQALHLQVDAYYNEVENKIVAVPTSNFFRWTMKNLNRVEIKGVDVSAETRWRWGRDYQLTGRLSYTYQKAQDFSDPDDEFYGGQIDYIPWHSGSVILNGSYKDWELNYSFLYVGERYSASANTPINYRLPWYTSDLSVAKPFHWRKKDLKLTLEVNNLLDQHYEVVLNYPMPGRNYKLTLSLNI